MTEKKSRISDLPSSQELSAVLPIVKTARGLASLAIKTGLGREKAQRIVDGADKLLAQSDILTLPDRFNAAFAKHGWIATSSLSVSVMRQALQRHEEGDEVAAEAVILDWLTPETINLFAIQRSKSFSSVPARWHQLREALSLTEEGRYWAAVPLILIASDGFASDVIGSSPFEKNADLTLFDSMIGHPTSLPAAIGRITKGVRKSSDEPLSIPLRHGILHGRSLGYANRAVCGKSWMLMIALVDWAIDKRHEAARRAKDEARRSASWSDVLASVRRNHTEKQAMEAFTTKRWDGPFDRELAEHEPPLAFLEFLEGWKSRNYGIMAARAVNLTRQKHGRLAGQLRMDAEVIQLIDFEIISVTQVTVARSEAYVRMRGQTFKKELSGNFVILAFRYAPDGGIAMPGDDGEWHVQQGCMFDLMHERTAEARGAAE